MESVTFSEMKMGCKITCVKAFLTDLLGSQYLFEVYHTSLTIKNSENVGKSSCFENIVTMENITFFSKWRRDLWCTNAIFSILEGVSIYLKYHTRNQCEN